jgi:hypothetical protein
MQGVSKNFTMAFRKHHQNVDVRTDIVAEYLNIAVLGVRLQLCPHENRMDLQVNYVISDLNYTNTP